jgi:hypothetical protein
MQDYMVDYIVLIWELINDVTVDDVDNLDIKENDL